MGHFLGDCPIYICTHIHTHISVDNKLLHIVITPHCTLPSAYYGNTYAHYLTTRAFKYNTTVSRPTMKLLRKLQWRDANGTKQHLNIIKGCSTNYDDLGIFLLHDENLVVVTGIKDSQYNDPEKITKEIFRRWIQGGSTVSWQHLCTALQNMELNALAEELMDALRANQFI